MRFLGDPSCLRWLSHRSGNRQPKTYVKREATITVFELLMMGGVSPETCWAINKHWNNKFYHTVASCWFFLWDLWGGLLAVHLRSLTPVDLLAVHLRSLTPVDLLAVHLRSLTPVDLLAVHLRSLTPVHVALRVYRMKGWVGPTAGLDALPIEKCLAFFRNRTFIPRFPGWSLASLLNSLSLPLTRKRCVQISYSNV